MGEGTGKRRKGRERRIRTQGKTVRLNDKVGMNDQIDWHSVASLHKSMIRTEGEREN